MAEIYGGVETGGTWCVCALGTGPDDIVEEEQFATAAPEQTLERIVGFFRARRAPKAVGIGSFGPLDLDPESPRWGYVTSTPKPGWQSTPVGPALRDRLQVPVVLDTDVNAAALGESVWGAGRGAASSCYLTVGTGIGGGLIIDGRPLHGLVHPEIGHMFIPHDRVRDPFEGVCPIHGDCWEGLASGPAIARRWQTPAERLPAGHPSWTLEADYLAVGILSVISVVSPHRVILGGGVLEHRGLLALVRRSLQSLLRGYLEQPMLSSDGIEAYLVPAQLGDRAGVLGAIALAAGAGALA
jgi:fructokinase